LRALDVARPHVAGEPIGCIVGHRDGISLVPISDDREYGAKDLLAGDGHVVGHVGEYGRAHIVALIQAVWATETAGD
jgi:hypothetical protein